MNKSSYVDSLLWMVEAYDQVQRELNHPSVDEKEVLKNFAYALFKKEQQENPNGIVPNLFELMLKDKKFYHNVKLFLKNNRYLENFTTAEHIIDETLTPTYKALCNGEYVSVRPTMNLYCNLYSVFFSYKYFYFKQSHLSNADLYCYYKCDTPFLRLAPFKVELLHRKPDIILFRNVLSNREISIVKKISKPKVRLTDSHSCLFVHTKSIIFYCS